MSARSAAGTVSPGRWQRAIKSVNDGGSVYEVARRENVDRETLRRRARANNASASKRGPKPMLGVAGEKKLEEWILINQSIGKCVTKDMLREVVRRIAQELYPGDSAAFSGGRKFLKGFLKRHPTLSIRTGEATERKRVYALDADALQTYFASVKPLVIGRSPAQKWNMDEFGRDLMNVNDKQLVCVRCDSMVRWHFSIITGCIIYHSFAGDCTQGLQRRAN